MKTRKNSCRLFTTAVLCFLLGLTTPPLYGQLDKISFDHLESSDGLPNPVVTAITKDHQGFLWFGTYNGLGRYDGYRFHYYSRNFQDSSALQDCRITVLYEDQDKNLWVGTHRSGLYRYIPEKDNFVRYTPERSSERAISDSHVTSIYQDQQGGLWVGTFDGLNYKPANAKVFSRYKIPIAAGSRFRTSTVMSVCEDSQGTLLALINENEVYTLDRVRQKLVRHEAYTQILTGYESRLMYADADRGIWFSTKDHGIVHCTKDFKKVWYKTGNDGCGQPQVHAFMEDNRQQLWAADASGTLHIFQNGKVVSRISESTPGIARGLSSNVVNTMYCDDTGSVWIGTFDGVDIYHPDIPAFEFYTTSPMLTNSLSARHVLDVMEDRQGRIWVGTDRGGLNLYDRHTGTFQHFRHNDKDNSSISSDVVKTLYEDRAGNFWIGTLSGGLNRMNRTAKTFEHIVTGNPEYDEALKLIWSLHEDHNGDLWIGTLGHGLFVYHRKNKVFEHFRPMEKGGLTDYNIFEIFEDSRHRLWIGTENKGLLLFDFKTRKFTSIQNNVLDSMSLSDDHPWSIAEDRSGTIWIATADGLNELVAGTTNQFKRYYKRHGLGNSITLGINEDTRGNLWIPTGYGISKFDRRSGEIKNYSKDDGLQEDHYNINASIISKTGLMYVGGPSGLQVFDTRQGKDNTRRYPMRITGLKIFDQPVPLDSNGILKQSMLYTRDIELTHDDRFVTITFAYLNFISPGKNRYAYRLRGVSENWVLTSSAEATFTNLNPGSYEFEVKGQNNDGYWNDIPATLAITMLPPWWKTWWFRGLVILTVTTGVYVLYRYRIDVVRSLVELRSKEEIARHQALLMESQLQAERLDKELTQSKLALEVKTKNAELASSTMNIAKQNEILLQIKEDIGAGVKMVNGDPAVTRHFRQIERLINREIKREDNLDQFEGLFNQLHENFIRKLKDRYPGLTSRDLRFIAYMRMNLTSKEIAAVFNLSPRGVEDLRYRIRKKMNIESSVSLSEYILAMEV